MQSIIEELAIQEWEDPDNYAPSYNIAPTQTSPILIDDGMRRIKPMRWGLISSWSKDMSFGARMINARAETIAEKPSFRGLLPRKRCIVIADGYYEWQKTAAGKQPHFIQRNGGGILPMAGLWDMWINQDWKPVFSYTIITTTPQPDLSFIHDRMPVILGKDKLDHWLKTQEHPPGEVLPLLNPTRDKMAAWPVSTLVNSPANNNPGCQRPLN